eukprot:TRINITY_DN331_c1_g1_i13.p1 TRINITY_DN331_c1_g1~~TRINITY_DN331_c1_g1_i13.p1  ORF type:complete len:137 (+),score=1.05 TRINITY_DN331_c1_g1_i13:847-1257(+)
MDQNHPNRGSTPPPGSVDIPKSKIGGSIEKSIHQKIGDPTFLEIRKSRKMPKSPVLKTSVGGCPQTKTRKTKKYVRFRNRRHMPVQISRFGKTAKTLYLAQTHLFWTDPEQSIFDKIGDFTPKSQKSIHSDHSPRG